MFCPAWKTHCTKETCLALFKLTASLALFNQELSSHSTLTSQREILGNMNLAHCNKSWLKVKYKRSHVVGELTNPHPHPPYLKKTHLERIM